MRRLQEYYWRYLAARWGYSTAVHSWELMNEGDPASRPHFAQAEAFGQFMHQWDRNHLVTTSFWHSYPAAAFWNNPSYASVDYADLHAYSQQEPLRVDPHDAAELHLAYSAYTAKHGLTKPTVRGETGIACSPGKPCPELRQDRHGTWLHNLTWARLDAGGLYDLYWWTREIVEHDLYFHYQRFRQFMDGIPLANGRYEDAQAWATDPNTRVVGQRDTAAKRAHLWIQQRQHTWWNAIHGETPGRLAGSVSVPGFAPGEAYPVERWEFDGQRGLQIHSEIAVADPSGSVVIELSRLADTITDLAVKIGHQGRT
jgi:hypothetical protein